MKVAVIKFIVWFVSEVELTNWNLDWQTRIARSNAINAFFLDVSKKIDKWAFLRFADADSKAIKIRSIL